MKLKHARTVGFQLWCTSCLFLVILFAPIPFVSAQSVVADQSLPASAEVSSVNVEMIDDAVGRVESNSDFDTDKKSDLIERLQRAKQSLLNANKLKQQTDAFAEMMNGAAGETERLKVQLSDDESRQSDSITDLSPEQLTSQIIDAELQLTKATSQSQQLAAEPARRQARLADLLDQLSATTDELESIRKQQAEIVAPSESAIETRIRKLWLAARGQELQQTKELLLQERAAYSATTVLLPLQQQLANQAVSTYRERIDRLKNERTQQQREQAADTMRQTQDLVGRVPEALADLAKENVELAQRQRTLIAETTQATANVSEIEAAKDEVVKELATSIGRVESVGLTDALGAMFRERRDSFQELADRFQPNRAVSEKIAEHKTESFRLEDAIRNIDVMLNQLSTPKVLWESDSIDWKTLSEPDANWVLLKKHRKLLADTLEAHNSLLQSIVNSDTSRRELRTAIEKYDRFVSRRLFWTRSASIVSFDELKYFPVVLAWIANPSNWLSVPHAIGRSFRFDPLQSALASLFGISLLIWRSRIRRFITEQGHLANRSDSIFCPTFMALLASIASAATWPIAFTVVGFLLTNGADDRFAEVLGRACYTVAIFVASREALRDICRDGGLADAHLGWSSALRKHLRFHLQWYTFLGAACVLLMVMLFTHPNTGVRTLGTRWLAVGLFVVIAAFHHVVLRNNSPIYADVLRANPNSVIYRRRQLLWSSLVLFPLIFSAIAMVGYLDTVLQLGRLVQFSLLWLLTMFLILALVYRWISIRRRDLARRQAMKARRKRLEALADGDDDLPSTDANQEFEIADLPTLDLQTRQTAWVLAAFVAIVGLAVIWQDILPAIEYFGELTLWRVGTGDSIETVSLLDLCLSGLVVLGIVFAARNFVSLLELVVLSRTSLDSGARYAMSMLLRYVLFIVGAMVVFNLLSIPVQQLGWLLAAVSVGIGFGLQEIIANFVCGIILLLERPVRVGDVVTIGDTTGSVTRIQMRATTVTNWDRKELVIPNKDLITEKVLNWSLSNVVNRMTLTVGVQYGADPDKVRSILFDVVGRHPEVLKDPAPAINLESFGQSSLDFVVRFYLPNLNNRISVLHEVNTAIVRAFEDAEIGIPFPQREVKLTVVSDQEPIPFSVDGTGDSTTEIQ